MAVYTLNTENVTVICNELTLDGYDSYLQPEVWITHRALFVLSEQEGLILGIHTPPGVNRTLVWD